jgi:hypothetical protein
MTSDAGSIPPRRDRDRCFVVASHRNPKADGVTDHDEWLARLADRDSVSPTDAAWEPATRRRRAPRNQSVSAASERPSARSASAAMRCANVSRAMESSRGRSHPPDGAIGPFETKKSPDMRGFFLMRPRRLELPRTKRSTRPSTLRVYQFRHRRAGGPVYPGRIDLPPDVSPCVAVESVRRPRYVHEHMFDGRPREANPARS